MRNVAEMSAADILAEYNQLTGKDVKRFSSRATAIARLLDARTPNKSPVCPNCKATEGQTITSEETFICVKCSCEYRTSDNKVINQGDADMATRKHPKTRTNKTAAKKAASKKIAPKKENGKKPNADRSASTANSWTSPKTRAARSKHHGVRVGSTDYRSVKHAFEELKLPLGRHIAFRGKLKKEGALTFEFGDKKFNFKLIAD